MRLCELREYKWNEYVTIAVNRNLSNCEIARRKKFFGASTGFEPVASAFALQCSTSWAMNTHTLEAGQFIEFINPWKKWNTEWDYEIINLYNEADLSGSCCRRDSVQVQIEKWKIRLHVLTSVHVLQKTLNLAILRCCFAEGGKEMYQNVKCTYGAIVLLIKTYCFVTFWLPSSSLLKLPNNYW